MEDNTKGTNESRRRFVKAAVYTAPLIVTLKATPAFAQGGSGDLTVQNSLGGADSIGPVRLSRSAQRRRQAFAMRRIMRRLRSVLRRRRA